MTTRSQRSSSYPSHSIEHSIQLVQRVYENFGSGNYYAKREEIGKTLGLSAAYLQTQVSSAVQYGLLDLKSGEGYKPTKLFVEILKPIDEKQKIQSLLKAFKSPSLYVSLIEKFENEVLPSISPLSNILLHHFNISDKASERAASIFIENARYLNLISDDNILNFNIYNDVDNDEETVELNEKENISGNIKSQSLVKTKLSDAKDDINNEIDSQPNVNKDNGFMPFNILLKGKKRAQLIIPNDIEATDFDTIVDWIMLMKRSF